jgi:hypothetical protein
MKDYPCEIKETVDFEYTKSGNPSLNDLYGITAPLTDLMGRKPMIYTGPYFWKANGSNNSSWSQYDLWIANYGVNDPMKVLPWLGDWKIWQFSDRIDGAFYGVGGEKMLDGNYFNGTLEDLYKWTGASIPVDPNPPIGPPIIIPPAPAGTPATVVVGPLNVRSGVGTKYSLVLPALAITEKLSILSEEKDSFGNTWGKIGDGKYVCMIYYGTQYVKYDSLVPPQPPVTNKLNLIYVLPRYVNGGPSIIAGSDAPKANHPNFLMDGSWQTYVKNLNANDQKRWDLWIAPDVGPTKGLNSNGKAIYIPATWSFNVLQATGNVSNGWTEINCINMSTGIPDFNSINHEKTPHLVNRMTTVDKNGKYMSYPLQNGKISAWELVNDPVASPDGKMWIPSEYLKSLCTVVNNSLNVRDAPSTSGKIVGGMVANSKTYIYELRRDTSNNTWGKIGEDKWICLVYQGIYYTDWLLR